MKILYIMATRMPTERAHGYQIAKVCEKLSEHGADVSLWYPQTDVEESKRELFSFYGVKKNFTIRAVPYALHRFVEGSIAYSHFAVRNFFYLLALSREKIPKETIILTRSLAVAWLFGLRGCRVVYNAHNFPERKKWIIPFSLSNVSGIIANSDGTASAFKKNGYTSVVTIRNGVETGDFSRVKETKQELRSALSLPPDKKIILYTGHLYGWKGVDVIMETATSMRHETHIVFVMVGGTSADIATYTTRVEREGISNILLVGHKEQRLIPQYLTAADVLLMPNIPVSNESNYYTSPLKMFEYMASQVPIIASDLPSLREVLNQNNALLIEPGNSQKLADAIQLLLRDSALASRISAQAFRDVQHYTWDNQIQKLYHFLVSLDSL